MAFHFPSRPLKGLAVIAMAALLCLPARAWADDKTDCERGNLDVKIRACTAQIAKEPGKLELYEWRGIAYGLKQDFDRAIADFTKLIEIYPAPKTAEQTERLISFYATRALYYERKKDYPRSLADYAKIISMSAIPQPFYIGRARVHIARGSYGDAVADFTKAIELALGNEGLAVEARAGRAWAYLKAGKSAEGLVDIDKALQYVEKFPKILETFGGLDLGEMLDTRGNLLEALGRRQEAIAAYEKALAANPDLEETRAALKRLGKR